MPFTQWIAWIYISRIDGDRRLVSIVNFVDATIIELEEYTFKKTSQNI